MKNMSLGPNWPRPRGHIGLVPGVTLLIQNHFLEYGHFAYKIKGNEAYNNMLTNILPLHTPLTPGVESKRE